MRLRRFLTLVPKAVRLWASILAVTPLLIGLVVGYETSNPTEVMRTMAEYGSAGLVFGLLLAVWLLCLGFVFADARRRGMRPVLWVLVAALFPHLLGFLLYFVLRQPIAAVCSSCGMIVSEQQRFCSSCGTVQATANASDVSSSSQPV